MDEQTQIIYDRLRELARIGQHSTYSEMGKLMGVGPRSKRLRDILDDISHRENEIAPLIVSFSWKQGRKQGEKARLWFLQIG